MFEARAMRPPAVSFPSVVLMVENDVELLSVAAVGLERMGCRVVSVESAEEALRHLKTTPDPIDVVFTDLRLGGVGGVGLIERLAALTPDLPIVATSALVEELDAIRARWGDRVRLIPKPYQVEDLRVLLTLSQSERESCTERRT